MSGEWTTRVETRRTRTIRTRTVAELHRSEPGAPRGLHVKLVARQVPRASGDGSWSTAALGLELWRADRDVPVSGVTILDRELDALELAIAEVRRINGSRGASEE